MKYVLTTVINIDGMAEDLEIDKAKLEKWIKDNNDKIVEAISDCVTEKIIVEYGGEW